MTQLGPIQNNAIFPYAEIQLMAETVCKSGLFGIRNIDQAMGLMMLCQAEGLHPMRAVAEYDIIQGKSSLKAQAMLSRFQAAGGKIEWLQRTNEVCEAKFTHPNGGEITIKWTMEDARRAKLSTGKDNWQKYPRQMLSARVISEGVRATYPSVLLGHYTPEEVQDFEKISPIKTSHQDSHNNTAGRDNNHIIDVATKSNPPPEIDEPVPPPNDRLIELIKASPINFLNVKEFLEAKNRWSDDYLQSSGEMLLPDSLAIRLIDNWDKVIDFVNKK